MRLDLYSYELFASPEQQSSFLKQATVRALQTDFESSVDAREVTLGQKYLLIFAYPPFYLASRQRHLLGFFSWECVFVV